MASATIRTPLEKFFSATDKNDQKSLLTSSVGYVKRWCDDKGIHFSYEVSAQAKEDLTRIGIQLHPVPFLSHSHPFCKMVENHLLIDVIPGLLGNSEWVFSSIKQSKIESIIKKAAGAKNNISFVNKCICARDVGRYNFDVNEASFRINYRSQSNLFPRDYIKAMSRKNIFIQDEIHHWSVGDMIGFLEKVRPKRLLATVVYPPELIAGFKQSQNPKYYSYKVEGDKLFFFPDNNRSEGYEQPLSLDWLFSANTFLVGEEVYTVKMVKSCYAHHLFEICRGRLATESIRFWSDFNTVDLKKIHEQRFRFYDQIPIRKRHLEKVYSYLMCLKKPDVESALAKLRQIFEDESDCRVVLFFEKFAREIIEKVKGKWDLFGVGWLEACKDFFLDILPPEVASLYSRWGGRNIFLFLFTLDTLRIEIKTQEVGIDFKCRVIDSCVVENDLYKTYLPEAMEAKFIGASMPKRKDWRLFVCKNPAIEYDEMKNSLVVPVLTWIKMKPSNNGEIVQSCSERPLMIEWSRASDYFLGFYVIEVIESWESSEAERKHWRFMAFNCFYEAMLDRNIYADISPLMSVACDFDLEGPRSFSLREGMEYLHINEDENEGKCETANADEMGTKDVKGPQLNESSTNGIHSTLSKVQMEEGSEERFELKISSSLHFDVQSFHESFKVLKVRGDGNCFYRAVSACLGRSENDWREIKEKIINGINEGIREVPIAKLDEMRPDGVYAEEWLVHCVAILSKVRLVIFEKEDLEQALIVESMSNFMDVNADIKDICLLHIGEHFDAIIRERIVEGSEKGSLFERGNEPFDDLNAFEKEKVWSMKITQLKNRQCVMVTDDEMCDYGHNSINYTQNLISDVESLIPSKFRNGYNVALFQKFESGGIGMHKDDEKCYDNDDILSINLHGKSVFVISNGKREMFEMDEGDFFLMKSGFQDKYRHGVESCSEGRVNVTFRKHIRTMKGQKIEPLELMINGCLIRTIAELDGRSVKNVMRTLIKKDAGFWKEWVKSRAGASIDDLKKACSDLKFKCFLHQKNGISKYGRKGPSFHMTLKDEHFSVFKNYGVGELVREVEEVQDAKFECEVPVKMILNELKSMAFVNSCKYIVDCEAAKKLASSFLERTSGKILSDVYSDFSCIKKIKVQDEYEGIEINSICGFAGSGKSRKIQNILRTTRAKFKVISPRKFLANEWSEKLCIKKGISTFEVALDHSFKKVSVVVIDELSLFPNGYLDLLIAKIKQEKGDRLEMPIFICLFDPLQATYHNDSDEGILSPIHETERIVKSIPELKYLMQSRRLCKNTFGEFFKSISMEPMFEKKDQINCYDNHLVAINEFEGTGLEINNILVASRSEARALKCKVPVMTFGESQGLNLGMHSLVVLSEYSEKQDEFRCMVALTRAKRKVSFCVNYRGGLSAYIANNPQSIFTLYIRRQEFSKKRMELMIGRPIKEIKEEIGCSDFMDREERLEGDPFLKGFIFLGQRVNSEDVELIEPECVEPAHRTHLALSPENFSLARNFDMIRAKELREFRLRENVTNQFCDNFEKRGPNGKQIVAGPLRFESIFPRHNSNDELTFLMAVKKRLVFSSEAKERAKLKEAGGIGMLMYNNFKEKFNLEFKFDHLLYEECVDDFERKKLSKSVATLANHSIRSDLDWPLNDIFLFMKSQLCTKYEKQYVDAKAGQTLACFQHMILVKFAPYCRYMEKVIRDKLRSNVYIHSNKNFNQLNEWVIENFSEGICIESDYEAFDASQDENILAFELALMEDMGMPNFFINDYIDLKCTLGCRLGHFAIMRFTGEFCTFLFNTLANMAFTAARYELSEKDPIAFAGDDMCILGNPDISENFEEIFEKISLKAKVQRTEIPMFCGWNLSKHGIVKEPELIYNRFMVALERGNVHECLENYAIEVSYAYMLGEKLFEVLKRESQVEYHQAVVRFIVKRLSKLKTNVKELFENFD